MWPLIVAPAAEALALASGASFVAPQGHNGSFIAITEASGILDERWKIIQNAQSTYWYTKNSSHINDNRTAWPCRGNKPGPSPSPSPPMGKCNPADEVPGFTCSTPAYCGPSKSFFWSGKAKNLTTCSSMCAKGTQGNCECFDWQGTDVGGVTCRLHGDATQIEHSGNGWSAYASNGADAREWIQTRAALAIRTTATMATGPNAADFLEDASMPDSMKVRIIFFMFVTCTHVENKFTYFCYDHVHQNWNISLARKGRVTCARMLSRVSSICTTSRRSALICPNSNPR